MGVMFREWALSTKIKDAVLFGAIPRRFTLEDVELWRLLKDPRQADGSPYLTDTATVLSNATIRVDDEGEILATTPNRNCKFLRRERGEDGQWVYSLCPTATNPFIRVDRYGRRIGRDGNPETKRPTS